MEKRKNLEDKFVKLISRFNIRQLAKELPPLLPNIGWSLIKKKMEKNKLPLNFAGKVVVQLLREQSDENFQKIVHRAILLDIILKKSKVWTTYLMSDKKTQATIDLNKLESQVLQAIRIEKLNANLYSLERDDFFYIMVVNRKLRKNRGVLLSKPSVFAVPTGNLPYIFIANKVPSEQIKLFVRGNGYESFKPCRLTGKSLQSLVSILKNKCDDKDIPDDISFHATVIKTSRSNIYSQEKQRLNYASHYFEENAPCIEELTIDGPPEYLGKFSDFQGRKFRTSMKLSSKNIAETLKLFALKGIISPPFPNYLRKFYNRGRNHLTLKAVQSQ